MIEDFIIGIEDAVGERVVGIIGTETRHKG